MTICNQTFEFVADHLKSISYNGPVGLSCDDTKLFATFRDDTAVGTGLERGARWHAPAAGGRNGLVNGVRAPELTAGNSANAAVTATAAAKQVRLLINFCVLYSCI